MTPAEAATPLHERYLVLSGRLSEAGFLMARGGLPPTWGSTSIPLFVSFAYADLPLGRVFTHLFPFRRPAGALEVNAKVIAVTQQFAKPFDEIPQGWNTVTLFEFAQEIPDAINKLRQVDYWYQLPPEEWLCLADEDAMEAMRPLWLLSNPNEPSR